MRELLVLDTDTDSFQFGAGKPGGFIVHCVSFSSSVTLHLKGIFLKKKKSPLKPPLREGLAQDSDGKKQTLR